MLLLCTLNAKYPHCAFGLRYLYANLGNLQPQAQILEFTSSQNPRDIAEKILALNPRIVGFGVYIWNTRATQDVVSILKKIRPDLIVVLGGPEVSYETESQAIYAVADYVICGEADFLFAEFCRAYLEEGKLPRQKRVQGALPDIKRIALPYPYYTDEDIRHRVIYVEASRGCPYKCEYCLSSLDQSVRSFDLDRFLEAMDLLIQRGARQFKFVDRTFNLSPATSTRILGFFLERVSLGLFLHFEMVPDRLPEALRELIRKFPAGRLQFEVGIQTWNPDVARLVSRRQDYAKIRENFEFLTRESGVHIHADLIAGLPGESLESFARGFDEVSKLAPHEIQLGLLKRLKGTPIVRHDEEWGMVYQEHPPFQVLCTRMLPYSEVQQIQRLSQFWDLIANSGSFKATLELLKELSRHREGQSWFWEFWALSKALSERHPQGNGIALLNLVESIWIYLTEARGVDSSRVREALVQDYTGTVKRDVPRFLREVSATGGEGSRSAQREPASASLRSAMPPIGLNAPDMASPLPRRQGRHWPKEKAQ